MFGISTADKRDLQRVVICLVIIIGAGVLVALDKIEPTVLVGIITGVLGYYLGRFDSPTKTEG
jgi:uncharacterized membrane protein (DUF4010 family)